MRSRTACLFAALSILAGCSQPAARAPMSERNFVACPIVQDTPTVPCYLAEHDGELYYLGIQTDISADFDPPFFRHKALIEGTVSDEPRICGGLVLKPVMASPLPDLDESCHEFRPDDGKYTVPFAPRPPGPSGGRLAYQRPPAPPEELKPPYQPRDFELQYDFDMLVMGRHAADLTSIVGYAEKIHASQVKVTGYRGETLLSDGTVMTEREGMDRTRAEEVADLLKRGGLDGLKFDVSFVDEPIKSTGVGDWHNRKTVVSVEP
jgi:hypothetical protein